MTLSLIHILPGYPALRNAIVEKLKKENGLEYTAAQISCANGAKQSVCKMCIRDSVCTDCGTCADVCPSEAIHPAE